MAITAVIETKAGILEAINLFGNEEEAIQFGRDKWLAEGRDDDLMMDDPGYNAQWGGVSRVYVMHWFTDEDDVWVVSPEQATDLDDNIERGRQALLLLDDLAAGGYDEPPSLVELAERAAEIGTRKRA